MFGRKPRKPKRLFEWVIELEAGGLTFHKTIQAESFSDGIDSIEFYRDIDGEELVVFAVERKSLVYMERDLSPPPANRFP